jgi:hypothetical protein
VGDQHDPEFAPRAQVIACSTGPRPGMTVVWADELGPVIPRSFPPAPGWSADGHRVKAPLEDGRGPATTGGAGALRVRDGRPSPDRSLAQLVGSQDLLGAVETANPVGTIMVVTDNLSSHTSVSTRTWLTDHPASSTLHPHGCLPAEPPGGLVAAGSPPGHGRPVGCHPEEITLATSVATCQLNARARPWVWGRPLPSPRDRRHAFTYQI